MTTITRRCTAAALTAALAPAAVFAPAAAGHPGGSAPAKQRFTMSSRTIHGVDKPTHVRANGPIRGTGPVQVPAAAGRVNRFRFKLARGSVVVVARERSSASHPDLTRCIDIETGRGRFTVTGGTRAFRHATGKGTYTRRTTITGARDSSGKCLGQQATPIAIKTITRMTGKSALR
jgi:hypothetical protein